MLEGLLKEFIKIMKKTRGTKRDKIILKSFLRGLLAAEGFPGHNKNGTTTRLGIAFNPHSKELEMYKIILTNLGIIYGKDNGNALYIYGRKNLNKIYELDGFKFHNKRKKKFNEGLKNLIF